MSCTPLLGWISAALFQGR